MRTVRSILLAFILIASWGAAPPTDTPFGADSYIHAAETAAPAKEIPSSDSDPHALYHVMGVVLLAWFGVALFLFSLERKLSRVEKELRSIEPPGGNEP